MKRNLKHRGLNLSLRRYGVGVVRKVIPRPVVDSQYLEGRRKRYGTGQPEPESVNGNQEPKPPLLPHFRAPKQDPTCFDCFWTPAQSQTSLGRVRNHALESRNSNCSQLLASEAADDWITALQSAAEIIAQVDNGSLERWEPDGYRRSQTYHQVFQGKWEEYDPWECTGRASSTMDLYNGYGACTIFRMFQGLLAPSTIEPGMLRLLPSPKLATAYYLLSPSSLQRIQRQIDDLGQNRTLILMLATGMFNTTWTQLYTVLTPGADDITFRRGQPGPDFDSSGRGAVTEDTNVMPSEKEIAELGGAPALRAMGLQPWNQTMKMPLYHLSK
ncbi:DUF1479 domain protein [Metarhizium acridum CQMa 102]|uniref:DUF1479 domain protein n=1 Tax=Metarhizium acridum (strain CQMa 102) TaxID=655827 RepID=E9EDM8_METAQ|nr:DUF1479 domain protein [Metarhizium acridum CQMa 102]EFY85957.1 DUF1479 domain protein [Metarhizium acridum CQMa 102]